MSKVYRSIEFKVNLGNYEHAIIRAGIELDSEVDGGTVASNADAAQQWLEDAVKKDLKEAERNTVYGADSDDDDEKSFVSQWRSK